MSIYTDYGYENRADYLKGVSEDYGVPLDVIHLLAGLLGPEEDFDGLLSEVSDYELRTRHSR